MEWNWLKVAPCDLRQWYSWRGALEDVQTAGNHQPEVQVAINSASVVGKTQQGGETRGVACRRVVPTLYRLSFISPPSGPETYIPG